MLLLYLPMMYGHLVARQYIFHIHLCSIRQSASVLISTGLKFFTFFHPLMYMCPYFHTSWQHLQLKQIPKTQDRNGVCVHMHIEQRLEICVHRRHMLRQILMPGVRLHIHSCTLHHLRCMLIAGLIITEVLLFNCMHGSWFKCSMLVFFPSNDILFEECY